MRRAGLLALGLLVSGCKVLQDAFSAHPGSAAQADGQSLTVERLADIASRLKGMPLETPNLTTVANAYLGYTSLAMSLAKGRALNDSSTVARVMWPTVSQLKIGRYLDRRNLHPPMSAQQVDSAYNAGELRAFQHILITVSPRTAPPVVLQKRNQANTLWRSLVLSGGANFAAVARRASEDPASKSSGGYLDVGGRGRFVPQFEDAAWQLTPGSMSGVVRSSFGFHIIRRPPLAEIRDTFAAGLEQIRASRSDSAYFASLSQTHKIEIVRGAGQAIRGALDDLDAAGRSTKNLATYSGGTFEIKDFVRWLFSIDPRYGQMLAAASDSQVNVLLRQLVEQALVLREADSSGIQPTDSEWARIRAQYDTMLTALQQELSLNATMLHDSATTDEGRTRLAMARVNDYFDRIVAGQAQFLPIPPLLTQVLRERGDWSIDAAAVQRSVERATALRASADSLRPSGTGAQMQPAAGPPPVTLPDTGQRPARPVP